MAKTLTEKTPRSSPSPGDGRAVSDVLLHRSVGGALSYQVKSRLKPRVSKKFYELQALGRIRRDLVGAHQSARTQHIQELNATNANAARAVRSPSRIRYGMFISACILMDLLGLALTGLAATGVGLVITIIVSVVVIIFMWLFGRLVLGKRLKQTTEERKRLRAQVGRVKNDIVLVRAQYVRATRLASKVGRRFPRVAARTASLGRRFGRALSRLKPVGKTVGWITKFLKNPIVIRVGEFIPAIQAWPWWTIGGIATYIEHRTEHRSAQEFLAQYNEVKREVVTMTDEAYGIQVEAVDHELVSTASELGIPRTRLASA